MSCNKAHNGWGRYFHLFAYLCCIGAVLVSLWDFVYHKTHDWMGEVLFVLCFFVAKQLHWAVQSACHSINEPMAQCIVQDVVFLLYITRSWYSTTTELCEKRYQSHTLVVWTWQLKDLIAELLEASDGGDWSLSSQEGSYIQQWRPILYRTQIRYKPKADKELWLFSESGDCILAASLWSCACPSDARKWNSCSWPQGIRNWSIICSLR